MTPMQDLRFKTGPLRTTFNLLRIVLTISKISTTSLRTLKSLKVSGVYSNSSVSFETSLITLRAL
jgi:hypothetical protein